MRNGPWGSGLRRVASVLQSASRGGIDWRSVDAGHRLEVDDVLLLCFAELAARCRDVLSAGGANAAMNAATHKVMLEIFDPLGAWSPNVARWIFVVRDQIDLGFDAPHQSDQAGSVFHGVVEAGHHDVLEGDSLGLVHRQFAACAEQVGHAVPFGDGHHLQPLGLA